MSLNKDTG
jgi:hypothetical protein